MNLGKASVGTFSDGEINVEILENVRGRDVFIVQPTSQPTNDNLMELLVMVIGTSFSNPSNPDTFMDKLVVSLRNKLVLPTERSSSNTLTVASTISLS